MIKIVKFLPAISSIVVTSLPLLVGAQPIIDTTLGRIVNTSNAIIAALFVVATLVFLWGIVKFIASAGDEAGKKAGKSLMMWGIIGLAVMAAAWGITKILIDYFQVPSTGPIRVPIPS